MKPIDESIIVTLDDHEEVTAIELLIELGHMKGYVTFLDLLEHFPEIENDNQILEEVISLLVENEIQYIDESELTEDLITEDDTSSDQVSLSDEDKMLEHLAFGLPHAVMIDPQKQAAYDKGLV